MAGTVIVDAVQAASTSQLVIKNGVASTPPTVQDSGGTEIGKFCRAWVNFNGTGTVAINASFNVSSITDNGAGDYTANFTTAMPDVNYSFTACVTRTSGQALTVLMNNESTVPATGSLRLLCVSQNASTGTATDSTNVCIAVFR